MTLELNELAARVAELVAAVEAGEPVLLTRGGMSAAHVQPTIPPGSPTRKFGLGVGLGPYYMAPDFNDPLPDEFWFGDGK
jgi:antitoxin (DNA-binding transcriptional repressor) of toxin-antitoxin stability system